MITPLRGVLLVCAAGVLTLTAAACGDDDADSSSSAQQGDVDAIEARIQRNEILFTLKGWADLQLHEIDESINAGEVPEDALPRARLAIRYTELTEWPTELQEGADGVTAAAVALVTALDAGDTEAAKQPATDLHDAWHDFNEVAWAEIGGDLPPEAGIEADHEGSETPTAEETPSESATEPTN